jgi:hypothetical protein
MFIDFLSTFRPSIVLGVIHDKSLFYVPGPFQSLEWNAAKLIGFIANVGRKVKDREKNEAELGKKKKILINGSV